MELARRKAGNYLIIDLDCGRTTVIRELFKNSRHDIQSNNGVSYYYCQRMPDGSHQTQNFTTLGILRTLARQLCDKRSEQDIFKCTRKLFENRADHHPIGRDDAEELLKLLLRPHPGRTNFLCIDALDECVPETLLELLKSLQILLQSSHSNVKILLSSRDEPVYLNDLQQNLYKIKLDDYNKKDVKSFIRQNIDNMKSKNSALEDSSIRADIADMISSKAGSM